METLRDFEQTQSLWETIQVLFTKINPPFLLLLSLFSVSNVGVKLA